MKSQLKNLQRGYSLIELSIALAIIGVVIAGSIIGVQSILRTNNVNKTISQTNTATNRITARLTRDSDYSNATTAKLALKNVGIWEENFIVRDTSGLMTDVNHPFGNNIYTEPTTAALQGVDTKQAYIYTLTGIPVAACADLAVGIEGLALAMSIKNEDAPTSGYAGSLPGTSVKTSTTSFDSSSAQTACNGATTPTSTASIVLFIPRR